MKRLDPTQFNGWKQVVVYVIVALISVMTSTGILTPDESDEIESRVAIELQDLDNAPDWDAVDVGDRISVTVEDMRRLWDAYQDFKTNGEPADGEFVDVPEGEQL